MPEAIEVVCAVVLDIDDFYLLGKFGIEEGKILFKFLFGIAGGGAIRGFGKLLFEPPEVAGEFTYSTGVEDLAEIIDVRLLAQNRAEGTRA